MTDLSVRKIELLLASMKKAKEKQICRKKKMREMTIGLLNGNVNQTGYTKRAGIDIEISQRHAMDYTF